MLKQKPRFVILAALTAIAAVVLALFGAQAALSTPRTPLVVIGGRITQMPTSDNLAATITGCGVGSAMRSVAADGTAVCVATGGGGGAGTVTSVATAAPLAGGTITGAGTISLNTGTGVTTSGGNLIADILTGLTLSGNHIVVDETREQRRVSGACTGPNAIDTVNADGTVVCTTGVLDTSNVSGTANTMAKFTGTNAVGNSSVTDDGTTFKINTTKLTVVEATGATTIAGTTTINASEIDNAPTSATGISIVQSHTAQTSTPIGLSYDDTGATAGSAIDSYGIKVNEVAGCGTDCTRKNYGIYTSASGATNGNVALVTHDGDVILNDTSGTTTIRGASAIQSTLMTSGLVTLLAGLTGLPAVTCATGQVVTAHAADGTVTCAAAFDPTKNVTYFADMLSISTTNNAFTDGIFQTTLSGTGATAAQQTDETGHPGIARFSTGTTTTGRSALMMGANSSETFILGTGAFTWDILIRPLTLCDGVTDICTLSCGLIDSASAADSTDGVYLKFAPATSSNWRTVTVNNTTKSEADTSPAKAPSASTWTHLQGAVNSAGTSVTFSVDGAAAGTVATNLPSGAARAFGFGCAILKSAGTTARLFDLDYLSLTITGLSR